MEATNTAVPPSTGVLRTIIDLLLFAGASLGAGILTALAAAALVILLAQPADAEEARSIPGPDEAPPAAQER